METNSAGACAVSSDAGVKRKRSPEDDGHAPLAAVPPKTGKTTTVPTTNVHLAINYLARQYNEDLPLISNDDSLPQIIALLQEYHGVLDRHESMACNLGARPLGPILMKRFERFFDGPPKVLKNYGKDGTVITWLDVVEFARNKPEQFALDQRSEGQQVCQFYTKQCRVQITEEDYLLISSGIPQKLIPPQPIVEDEEKELGTLEIVEKNLSSICHAADQVAARTRQLRHRINGRKQAILERRANAPNNIFRGTSPLMRNGTPFPPALRQLPAAFVAVNNTPGHDGHHTEHNRTGASATIRDELMSKFLTHDQRSRRDAERAGVLNGAARRSSSGASSAQPGNHHRASVAPIAPTQHARPKAAYHLAPTSSAPTAIAHVQSVSNTDSSTGLPQMTVPSSGAQSTPDPREREHDGPFKTEMTARMEALKRGDRILPPCDRCRRLHMDCVKNLTACKGCTKKHAKCNWRDVREREVFGPDATKILIPANEVVRHREASTASVGYRPEDEDIVPSHSPINVVPSNGFGGGDNGATARMMAIGAMTTSGSHLPSQHSTPDSDYHSPVHPYSDSQPQQIRVPQHEHDMIRVDSGPSSRGGHLHSHSDKSLARIDSSTLTAPAESHTEKSYGERRDGHQSMVVQT